MASFQKLTMFRGDSKVWEAISTTTDGGPLDLTGSSLLFTVKDKVDGTQLFQLSSDDGSIVITDAESGAYTITTSPADTTGVSGASPTYQWDVQCTDATGAVQTLARGTLRILGDITTAPVGP